MLITRPLEQYQLEFKDKFRMIAQQTFDQYACDSNVDIKANNALCAEIDTLNSEDGSLKKRLTRFTVLCVVLWGVVAASVPLAIFGSLQMEVIIGLVVLGLGSLIALFTKVHPKIKRLRNQRNHLQSQIEQKVHQGWRQMEGLNCLYDWDMFYRMFSKTIPIIDFDDFVPTARMSQFSSHGMNTDLGEDTSVLYAHSGSINGNPFAILRSRTMRWGTKTYSGSITIHWTTNERGSDGRSQTRHHSQTLTATLTKPYPEYTEITQLLYGHAAAPELTFHRTKNTFDYKEGKLLYTLKRKWLEGKSRKFSSDYSMDSNDEFEVLFTTTDRSNNQQFFLLFPPLAQQGIVELIKDRQQGYGDDFEFIKSGQINNVISDHLQAIALDLNPYNFRHYDFNRAKDNFITLNCNFFRAVYFAMAPLLSIAIYQDSPKGYMTEPLKKGQLHSCHWEHESIANFWGDANFQHPACETANILKTAYDGRSVVEVTARGHASESHVTYVKKFGGDGRWHDVAVHWREYYPVTGTGSFHIHDFPDDASSQTPSQRYKAKSDILTKMGRKGMYRRNIWSAIN